MNFKYWNTMINFYKAYSVFETWTERSELSEAKPEMLKSEWSNLSHTK